MRAKHGLAKLTARQVATALDLSRFSSACHLGGTCSPPGFGHKRVWGPLSLYEIMGPSPACKACNNGFLSEQIP